MDTIEVMDASAVMDTSEMIDKISARFNDGRGRCFGHASGKVGGSNCVYLRGDGNRCAVGVLLPDGHPAQDYEGGVLDLLREFPDLQERLLGQDLSGSKVQTLETHPRLRLLVLAQRLHDDEPNWTDGGDLSDLAWARWAGVCEGLFNIVPRRAGAVTGWE